MARRDGHFVALPQLALAQLEVKNSPGLIYPFGVLTKPGDGCLIQSVTPSSGPTGSTVPVLTIAGENLPQASDVEGLGIRLVGPQGFVVINGGPNVGNSTDSELVLTSTILGQFTPEGKVNATPGTYSLEIVQFDTSPQPGLPPVLAVLCTLEDAFVVTVP